MYFPVDLMWEEPTLARFLDRLSSFSCSIWFDGRGRGASDPLPHVEDRFAEALADDMLALLDYLGCEQVAVLGFGAPWAILFAASHPERTKALILHNTAARLMEADDYPQGATAEVMDLLQSGSRRAWGADPSLGVAAPSLEGDDRLRRWAARAQRLTCTPDEAAWRFQAYAQIDLRAVLPSVQMPTVVFHAGLTPVAAASRYVAEHIAGARYVELGGEDYVFFVGDSGPMLDAIEEFLTGQLPAHHTDRVLATVLFTDIVGSTEQAARLGDRRWRDLLATHDALVRAEVLRFRGRLVKSTGDGALATFDGPGRAIRCACAVRDSVRSLGIDVHSGLHTGEVEVLADDIAGVAVHLGARVSAAAGAGEVLVSSTVRDLVAGSGIEFEDRGEHELKGVPGSWRLYAVAG
jgi:class 3 adenylate cyclase/pimeloyl-ACP methyl ester carboxylesterase